VTGAADVRIFGERKYAMRVWLDPDKLAAYKLTTQDAEDAIRRSNLEVPAGRIESTQREFSVTSQTDLTRPSQFADIIIKNANGFPVRIRDVGRVQEAAADERSGVTPQRQGGHHGRGHPPGHGQPAGAEPRRARHDPQAARPTCRRHFDRCRQRQLGVHRPSIQSVFQTILEAIVLVALVIFVFLRTVRASIIPIVTIPVCLIGTFALMALAGFTINTLTLLALVLAIGLVVDDAIVVLENIYRHIEEGMDPFSASIKGVREVGFAVVAMTLTLVAVYAPLAFTPGRTGRLFIEFALALAGAVAVSGFIALTLSPMMCSLLLRHNPNPSWFDSHMERWLNALTAGYQRVLTWLVTTRYDRSRSQVGAGHSLRRMMMDARWIVIGVMVLSGIGIAIVLPGMKRELSPLEDRGQVLAVVTAPDGATLDYTNRYVGAIERMGQPYKEFDRIFVSSGNPTVSQANVFFRAIDWDQRSRSVLDVARELQPKMAGLAGVTAFPITPPSLGQGFRERPVNFVLITTDSYQNLAAVTRQFMDEIAKNPGIVSADIDLRLNKPELKIDVNREKAADLGVSVDVVARAIETMLGGRQVTRYKREGDQFDVIVQTQASGRDTPDDVEKIFVRGRNDTMIPLASLVTVRESVAPRELNHFSQRRSVSITANLAPDYSLGQALDFLDATAAKLLKPGYTTDLNGTSREFRNSQGALGIVFALALLFIFLVLAAQFESFVDPLVIMLSVPLSMIGALLALQWSGGSLNVYSQIGLITLVGLITKHGILIVEFTNQLREHGMEMTAAVVKGASQRLRPILMTTGAMVLGAIPLALAHGAGSESRRQIGWVIVGGMSLGTLLTIFVVPTIYTLLARKAVPGPITAEAEDGPLADHGRDGVAATGPAHSGAADPQSA
jgi:multidrug efflux pump